MNKWVFTKLDMTLSDACNLCCSFCYAKGGCGNGYDQARVDKTLDWFWNQWNADATEKQRKDGVGINFYGGEPMLEFEHIKGIIASQNERAKSLNTKMGYGITTNMTLMTPENLEWCMANKVGVGASIDGCAPAHDSERKFRDGTGSSTIVYQNARNLVKRVGKTSSRMTVSPSNVHLMYEGVVFLIKDIGFSGVNAVLAGGCEWTDEKLAIYEEQLSKLTDWWINEMRQGRHYGLYHMKNALLPLWSGRRRATLCGAGRGLCGVDTEGNIYPCHRFLNFDVNPEYKIGTIYTGVTNTDLLNKLRTYNVPLAMSERCKDCAGVLACSSLCIHEMMRAGRGMFEPLPYYCKCVPMWWKMGMRAHSVLMAEGNKEYVRRYDKTVPKQVEQKKSPQKATMGVPQSTPFQQKPAGCKP